MGAPPPGAPGGGPREVDRERRSRAHGLPRPKVLGLHARKSCDIGRGREVSAVERRFAARVLSAPARASELVICGRRAPCLRAPPGAQHRVEPRGDKKDWRPVVRITPWWNKHLYLHTLIIIKTLLFLFVFVSGWN